MIDSFYFMALTHIVFSSSTHGLFFNKRLNGNIGTIYNIMFNDELISNLKLTSSGFKTFTF